MCERRHCVDSRDTNLDEEPVGFVGTISVRCVNLKHRQSEHVSIDSFLRNQPTTCGVHRGALEYRCRRSSSTCVPEVRRRKQLRSFLPNSVVRFHDILKVQNDLVADPQGLPCRYTLAGHLEDCLPCLLLLTHESLAHSGILAHHSCPKM